MEIIFKLFSYYLKPAVKNSKTLSKLLFSGYIRPGFQILLKIHCVMISFKKLILKPLLNITMDNKEKLDTC